ncbi:sensor histidine kinase [Kitasatospora sp. NPDC057904]|uniref:sensor histidine kinase n=1 Tax=Kitasatospora sp. NPDC057904 TaxID=3346275 RepID=UPI0036DE2603
MTVLARPPLIRRLRLRDLVAVDALAGAALCALALRDGLGGHEAVVAVPEAVSVVLALVLGAAVAVRRVQPWPSVWAVAVASPPVALQSLAFPLALPAAMVLVLYTLAVCAPRREAVLGLALIPGCTALGLAAAWSGLLGPGIADTAASHHVFRQEALGLVLVTLPLSGVWMIGVAVRANRAYTAGLRAQAEQHAREQVVEERLRIARELHDVVAHSMSLITMQASVAAFVADSRPAEAVKALTSIEATGRGALQEMRRLLGILRDADGNTLDPELLPAPGVADLDALVARTAGSGPRVELVIRGERRALPGTVELAVYRIAQEALTNVLKHADAGRGRVVLDYGPDTVTVEVADDGRGGSAGTPGTTGAPGAPGHGLIGMRERVAAFGGEFEAGPLPGRGYRVAARIPVEAAP